MCLDVWISMTPIIIWEANTKVLEIGMSWAPATGTVMVPVLHISILMSRSMTSDGPKLQTVMLLLQVSCMQSLLTDS